MRAMSEQKVWAFFLRETYKVITGTFFTFANSLSTGSNATDHVRVIIVSRGEICPRAHTQLLKAARGIMDTPTRRTYPQVTCRTVLIVSRDLSCR